MSSRTCHLHAFLIRRVNEQKANLLADLLYVNAQIFRALNRLVITGVTCWMRSGN